MGESGLDEHCAELAALLPDIVVRFTADGVVTYANPAALDVAGVPLVGMAIADFIDQAPPGSVDRFLGVTRDGQPTRFDIDVRDRHFDIRIVPQLDASGAVSGVIAVARDVTEAARAEAQRNTFMNDLARQARLLELAAEAIDVCDAEGRIEYWNHAAEELYGWKAEEVMGRDVVELVSGLDWPDHEAIEGQVLRDGAWHGRIPQRHRTGRLIIVDLHLSSFVDHDGSVKLMAIANDVTERVALEQRLQQAERVEAIGRLAGGVAHDFNNLLTVIMGAADLLSELVRDVPGGNALVRSIDASARRGARLTEQLLSIGRRQSLQPTVLDLATHLQGMRELVQRAVSDRCYVDIDVPSGVWGVLVDPGQFELALVNLCINARDALPHGGTVQIAARNIGDPVALSTGEQLAPDVYVAIAVTDEGHGMTDDVRRRAFEPFFTTKASGAGTGLGLSMVHGFIGQSNGHVDIESHPGDGTTVTLYLPRAGVAVPAPAPVAATRRDVGRGERILIVEDDTAVREFAVRSLQGLGYQTVEADTAELALACLDADPDVDLLFTDIVLPGTDGIELGALVRERHPALPQLFTSGYFDQVAATGIPASSAMLRKPYDRLTLGNAIARALHGRSSSH